MLELLRGAYEMHIHTAPDVGPRKCSDLELARRYPALRVNLADPGIVASNMIDLGHWYDKLADVLFKPLCKTPKAGVEPALRALAAAEGNRYYVGKGSRAIPARYLDPALDGRIWEATGRLIGA